MYNYFISEKEGQGTGNDLRQLWLAVYTSQHRLIQYTCCFHDT